MGRKRKLGDVYAFILPNGQYAFAHVLQEAAIGVYKHLGTSVNDLPTDNNEYMFIISVYRSVFSKWIFIENRPFETQDDAWYLPPKKNVLDWSQWQYGTSVILYAGSWKVTNGSGGSRIIPD